MESLLLRHVANGRVVMALSSIVVEPGPELLVTWIAPGTPIAFPDGLEDGRLLPLDEWNVGLRTWHGEGRLELSPRGRRHAIRLFWDANTHFRGWYVNLQAPLSRSALGFDTMDWQLDLWIEPGGKVHWKDEDHLVQALEHGLLTAEEARAAREEANRVLAEWRSRPAGKTGAPTLVGSSLRCQPGGNGWIPSQELVARRSAASAASSCAGRQTPPRAWTASITRA
jgi:hypothetical protein